MIEDPTKTYETVTLDIPTDTMKWLEERAVLCDLTPEDVMKVILVLKLP